MRKRGVGAVVSRNDVEQRIDLLLAPRLEQDGVPVGFGGGVERDPLRGDTGISQHDLRVGDGGVERGQNQAQ